MEAEIAWSRGKNDEPNMLGAAAATSFYFGRLEQGKEETRRAVASYVRQNQKENAALAQLSLADAQVLFGSVRTHGAVLKQHSSSLEESLRSCPLLSFWVNAST